MVKNKRILEKFENELIKKSPVNYRQNKKIFEEMYKHAVRLKALPLKDNLEGIEIKIKIAKALNSVR